MPIRVTTDRDGTIDRLVYLAGGDVGLVARAVRATQEFKQWRWWQRKRWASDLSNVVKYLAARNTAMNR